MRLLAALVLLVCAQARAAEPPALPAAWRVRSQYRALESQPEPTREAAYTLRLAEGRFLLELGPVRVLGVRSPASLTAWHTHDPTTIFTAEGTDLAGLILRQLPPIWSTPLSRWLTGDRDAYALVGHEWPSPPRITPDEGHDRTVREAGSVRVSAPESFPSFAPHNEPAEEFISTERPEGVSSLTQVYLPIEAGQPAQWGVDRASRSPVSSIRALAPRPAPIQPGDVVRGLRMFETSGLAVDLERAFEPERAPRAERRAAALLLIFERATGPDRTTDSAVAAITAARERLAENTAKSGVPRPLLIVRPLAVFDVSEYSDDALTAFGSRWSPLGTDALLESVEARLPAVLWTQPSRESIDLFAPGSSAAAVLIDPDGRLIDALRLNETSDLQSWLVETLEPAADDNP